MVYNMGVKFLFFNMLLIAGLALGKPALAGDGPPPLDLKGLYQFDFSGVPIGKVGAEIEQNGNDYSIATDVTATGILKLFTKHSSHTTVDAHDHTAIYESHYRTKNKKRYVKLVYDAGKIVEEKVEPPDNRATRPAVPAKLKNGAADLLSFNLRLREAVWKATKTGGSVITLRAYDGRRLTEVSGKILGKKTIIYGGENRFPVIKLALSRKPLAGFSASELEDYKKKEPPLYLYYSDDERLVPVKLEVTLLFGKVTGTLVKECRTGESCLLGIKE
jgi:hypothetical protein